MIIIYDLDHIYIILDFVLEDILEVLKGTHDYAQGLFLVELRRTKQFQGLFWNLLYARQVSTIIPVLYLQACVPISVIRIQF